MSPGAGHPELPAPRASQRPCPSPSLTVGALVFPRRGSEFCAFTPKHRLPGRGRGREVTLLLPCVWDMGAPHLRNDWGSEAPAPPSSPGSCRGSGAPENLKGGEASGHEAAQRGAQAAGGEPTNAEAGTLVSRSPPPSTQARAQGSRSSSALAATLQRVPASPTTFLLLTGSAVW